MTAFDRDGAARAALTKEKNVYCVDGLAALVAKLAGKRVVLSMLPAGPATEDTLAELLPLLSAGVHGLANGYCLMLGGTPKSVERFEPYARILAPAPDRGWLHCGPSGAGHFAKMIHNGIEYGMMQAFAEGFALLAARPSCRIRARGAGPRSNRWNSAYPRR